MVSSNTFQTEFSCDHRIRFILVYLLQYFREKIDWKTFGTFSVAGSAEWEDNIFIYPDRYRTNYCKGFVLLIVN